MPQLLPRTDSTGWVTPTLSDIIDVPQTVVLSDEQKVQQVTLLRSRLAQHGINAEVMDVLPTPSHLRFHLRPAGENLSTNNYETFIAQLRAALPELKKSVGAMTAEVLVSPQKPLIVQFLVRPGNYPSLNLGHILRHREFIDSPSPLTLPLGMSIGDQTLVRTLDSLRNLMIVGDATTRFHLLASILISLVSFNTPSEIRYALIGEDTDPFDQLAQTPHVLGGTLTNIRELRRLLDGLVKHLGQRKQQFARHDVSDIEEYNAAIDTTANQKPFPRILIVIDTIPFEKEWSDQRGSWFSGLYRLIKEGPAVGIHTILTAKSIEAEHIPPQLLALLTTQVILRPAIDKVEFRTPVQSMPLPFVDGIFRDDNGEVVAIELPAVDDKSLSHLVKYWRQISAKRSMAALAQGRQRSTGDTGLLTLRQDAKLRTFRNKATEEKIPEPQPQRISLAAGQDNPKQVIVAEREDAVQSLPDQSALGEKSYRQSAALAAYLGWLSVGPLVDVLDLTLEEARSTIGILQEIGVIEGGSGPMFRFIRLDKH